ncbi:MAG TPA: hypothetical protein VJ853_01325 [Thermoanaerobaculia bacterium]|nr:hypothetical protein [Thermoanaerobaculia bacterium]
MPDVLTITAIALVAYAASNILHEAVGHGGACLVSGGKPEVLSSVHFECGEDAMSPLGSRMVSAAGTIANFIAAAIGLALFRATDPMRKPHAAYFLWLFTTVNLLMGAGYFLFSGAGNIGDWAAVANGTMSPLIWRPAMTVFGVALYFLFARQCGRWLGAIVGNDHLAMKRARLLTVPAYIAGGVLFCVSGLFNPVGPILIAVSAAAASFGGASGLLWLVQFTRNSKRSTEPAELERNDAWIVAGCVASIFFVAILGPGIRWTAPTRRISPLQTHCHSVIHAA